MTYSNDRNLGNTKNTVASGKLEKAKLISKESDSIEFMFNPSELSFTHSYKVNSCKDPKVSFAHLEPSEITIRNIRFDTYEQGYDVLGHINKLKKALKLAEKGDGKDKRPPIYTFIWGKNKYLQCFIDTLTYKLTRFLPDGTPVQAEIEQLTLKEVDETFRQADSGKEFKVDRTHDSRNNKS